MKGQEAFNQYYHQVFGERWPSLLSALQKPSQQVMRWNRWIIDHPDTSSPYLGQELIRDESSQLLPFYVMDPASIVVAQALHITQNADVLDMCAAPGGKSLLLAENKNVQKIVCNEFSANRRERLKKVIQQYIPRNARDKVFVTGQDSTRIGLKFKDCYDAILLDAPCSGERHLLENKEELAQWSVKRTQGLAQKQYAMLCSALMCARIHTSDPHSGQIVYSTCALSPLENDGVIEKLLHKKSDYFRVIECSQPHPLAEKTKFGWQFLPDRCDFGPMYFCLLQKNNI